MDQDFVHREANGGWIATVSEFGRDRPFGADDLIGFVVEEFGRDAWFDKRPDFFEDQGDDPPGLPHEFHFAWALDDDHFTFPRRS